MGGGGQEMGQVEEGRLSKGWRAVHTPGRPVRKGCSCSSQARPSPTGMSAASCVAQFGTPRPLGAPPPGITEHCCIPAHAGVLTFTASLSLPDCPMTLVTVILILYLYELCFGKVK